MRYIQGQGEGVPQWVPPVNYFNPHPTGMVIQPNTTQAQSVPTPVQSQVRLTRGHAHAPYCGCSKCGNIQGGGTGG